MSTKTLFSVSDLSKTNLDCFGISGVIALISLYTYILFLYDLSLWSLISLFLSLLLILIVNVCRYLHRCCRCYVPTWRTHTDPSQEMSRTVTSPVPFFHGCGSPQGRYCHSDTLTTAVIICIYISKYSVHSSIILVRHLQTISHTSLLVCKESSLFQRLLSAQWPSTRIAALQEEWHGCVPFDHSHSCILMHYNKCPNEREREIWESLWRWNMAVHSE